MQHDVVCSCLGKSVICYFTAGGLMGDHSNRNKTVVGWTQRNTHCPITLHDCGLLGPQSIGSNSIFLFTAEGLPSVKHHFITNLRNRNSSRLFPNVPRKNCPFSATVTPVRATANYKTNPSTSIRLFRMDKYTLQIGTKTLPKGERT